MTIYDQTGKIVEKKFYHAEWKLTDLLKARNDGLLTDEGEAWKYRYSHMDGTGGKYDLLFRREPVAIEAPDHLALVAAAYRDAADRCKALRDHEDTTDEEALGAMVCASDILARTPADAEAHLTALLRAEYERGKAETQQERDLVEYVLQDDKHNRLTPRVVDIAYSAFHLGRSGENKDDGGPCDWFTDTRPMVMEKIAKIRADLALLT